MILGCLAALGSSIQNLAETGQQGRLLDYYFPHYLKQFARVYHFSYIKEAIRDFTDDPTLLERVYSVSNPGPLGRKTYTLGMGIQQRQWLKQCAVLRVYQATGVIPAIIAKRLYRIPFVTTYGYRYAQQARLVGTAPWKVAGYAALERLALAWADGVIVTTRELQDFVAASVPAQRIFYIPNGVDTQLFRANERLPVLDAGLEIIFVGRLEAIKDLPVLVQAMMFLRARGLECRLTVVGDGTLRQTLAGQMADAGLPVEFLGVIPHETLPEALHRAQVFVLPSLREGHPKALIEAMSCGLPCVASDCDGNRSLVTDGQTGLLFPIGQAEGLADQLEKVARRPEWAEALGRNARRTIVEQFDIHALLERETDLLADLARSNRRLQKSRPL